MGHHVTTPSKAVGRKLPAAQSADTAQVPAHRKLLAGQAVTLRARQLSVLRIGHGRVWVTLSHAGPYSRVRAGDHFLSRGQRLSLLPGQELVMESFESTTSSHTAAAHFSWETPGAAVSALQGTKPAQQGIGMGVLEPLRDLRHALGLAAGASGRLVLGLAHGAATGPRSLLNLFAIVFVAISPRFYCQKGYFYLAKKHAKAASAGSSAA